jgi:hypothetical protein
MPRPPCQRVVPLGEGLFQPLHDGRKLQPIFRFDVEPKLVRFKMEAPDLESEAERGFPKNPGKESGGLGQAEDLLPVVNLGSNFVPDPLSEFSFLPHTPYTGAKRCFALVGATKIIKKIWNKDEAGFHRHTIFCGSSLALGTGTLAHLQWGFLLCHAKRFP